MSDADGTDWPHDLDDAEPPIDEPWVPDDADLARARDDFQAALATDMSALVQVEIQSPYYHYANGVHLLDSVREQKDKLDVANASVLILAAQAHFAAGELVLKLSKEL